MSDLKSFIAKVADGASLTREETAQAFGILMSGDATPSQIGGLLMAMRVRGETEEEFVVYRTLYGNFDLWVRPKAMFIETVMIDGVAVPRFAYVEESK